MPHLILKTQNSIQKNLEQINLFQSPAVSELQGLLQESVKYRL